jgi:dTDP-4-amino-4,6-dideoxygalactose transaminase
MSIPFLGLKAQYAALKDDLKVAIDRVLEHGLFLNGPEVILLEEALAKHVGVKHAVACSSGTDALLMPLMAYGIGPGDAVFTTPFTFIATAEVTAFLGATPVFVDIDAATFNLDPARLEVAVARVAGQGRLRPRGIIPVDLFGLPADYDAIRTIADKYGLFVLEDAAQAFGGVYKGRRVGSLGHVAATSFYPTKPLGAYGDGGAVLTDDDALADTLRSIRQHGQGAHSYENVRIGLTGRLDTLQAAVLLIKLAALPGELEERQRVARRYTAGLSGLYVTPAVPQGLTSAWAQYSILSPHREADILRLQKAGIPTAIYYPIPLHLQRAFAGLGHQAGDFPVSEKMAAEIFSLPMHPYLSNDQIDRIVGVLTSD